ncbi:MAG TPA: hypothetical protein VFC84_08635 [Desulfosporosinus sp.]|nr:hypothetical protein [Desulfosporosinus sp.]
MLLAKIGVVAKELQKWQEMTLLVTRHQEYEKLFNEATATAIIGQNWLKVFDALHHHDPAFFSKQDLRQTIIQLDELVLKVNNVSDVPKVLAYKKIQELIGQKNQGLKELWQDYVDKVSKGQRSMLNALSAIIGESETAIRLKSITDLEHTWPVTQKTLDQLETSLQEIDGLTTGLNVTPEIQAFLTKLGLKQMRLSDLTPSITNWLEQQDLKKKIILSFGH